MRLVLLACALAASSGSIVARAQDLRAVATQRVVGLIEPMGAEHAISLGARAPIGDPREQLFQDAHLELGLASYTTPIDTQSGAYLEVSPLAFLVLRAELLGVAVWPIGLDGAGYYPVSGYDAPLAARPAQDARHAAGWIGRASAILQVAIPLGPLRLIAWNQLGVERASIGNASHWFSPRYDAVLAREEWMLTEDAMVLLEGRLDRSLVLRAGAYDALRSIPRSGYLANQAGLIAALTFERPTDEVEELMPFVRFGAYTNGRREGTATLLLGVTIRYAF